MKKPVIGKMACIIMLLMSAYTPVAPSPCNDGAGSADNDLWSVHNCWWDFVLWQYKAYRMWDSNWKDWGFRDACNIGEPYPKAHNASYLLTYGLTDGIWQWHGTLDYRRAGEAWASPNHNTIHYVPANTRAWLAQAQKRFLREDRTRLSCLLFDIDAVTANPATRAGDYVHEGWHHWQYKRGYSGHMNGPIGACTMNGRACDWYYWHGVGAYAFGEMHKYTTDGQFFHSPNQAQVEFLCDVSEMSKWWVPTSVRNRGRIEANQRLGSRFRNTVAYRCGDPRPW
jgi:hypothetical protein